VGRGLRRARIHAKRVDLKEARRLEPHLSRRAVSVFRFRQRHRRVPTVLAERGSARRYGGEVRTYTEATGIERAGDRVVGVTVCDTLTGAVDSIGCDHVVNAAGSWVGRVASWAGSRST